MDCSQVFAWFSGRNQETSPESLLPEFTYDGEAFDPARWSLQIREIGADCREIRFTSPDGLLELELDVRFYPDFDAVEYTPVLRNPGTEPGGLVENFRSLAWRSKVAHCPDRGHGGEPRTVLLRRNFGTKSNYLDFVAQDVMMGVGGWLLREETRRVAMVADEGRSSANWLPFWGVDFTPEHGILVGLGWSGAWRADFELTSNDCFTMTASQLATHFRVLPGEELRSLMVLVMFRDGIGVEAGQNRFRRLLGAHYAPHDVAGRPEVNPISLPVFGGIPTATHLQFIERFAAGGFPYDFFGIDAGWYGYGENRDVFSGTWGAETGNWRYNPAHPDGFAAITAAVAAQGRKSWLWFEPERAQRDTDWPKLHPEWYIDAGENKLLLDFSNPEAWRGMLDYTLQLFEENNLDQLHQDFNFNILPHWAQLDTPDRVGVAEMKYIAGLYAYWDALRAHNPPITIDHCASGGRRIDLESLRRGYVIWRSDAQCFPGNAPEQNQIQHYYLSSWYPFHAGGIWVKQKPFDEYDFFSGVANGVTDCTFIYAHEAPSETEWDYADHARLLREAVRLRPYFTGDYYPLSMMPERQENWCAFQYARQDGSGVAFFFRRAESPEAEEVFRLRAIDRDAMYEVERYGRTEKERISGRELEFRRLLLPPRSFEILFYSHSTENDAKE